MDKDRVKGTVDDAVGRAKRQIGEWTDDPNKQAEGTAQQIKGKVEKISGKVKDAVRDTADSSRPSSVDEDETFDNQRTLAEHRR